MASVASLVLVALSGSSVGTGHAHAQDGLEAVVRDRIQSARTAAQQHPGSASRWAELAKVLHAHGLHESAVDAYRRAMALEPQDPRWPYLAAHASVDFDASLTLLRRAHRLQRHDSVMALELAERLLRDGQLDEAVSLFETLSDSGAAATRHAQLGLARVELLQGRADLAANRLTPLEDWKNGDLHRLLAQARARLGDPAGAGRAASRARAYGSGLRPIDPLLDEMRAASVGVEATLDLAQRLTARGEEAEARFLLEKAAPRDRSGAVLLELGYLALERSENVTALELFRQAEGLVGSTVDGLIGVGRVHEARGDLAAAQGSFEEAVDRAPDSLAAREALGLLLWARRQPQRAAALLEAVVREDPTRYNLLASIAKAHRLAGDLEASLKAREALALLEPDQSVNLRKSAELQLRLGRFDEAEVLLRRVEQIAPEDLKGRFHLAWLLATAEPGDSQNHSVHEALGRARRLAQERPRSSDAFHLVAVALASAGRFDEAERLAAGALDRSGDAESRQAIERSLSAIKRRQAVRQPRWIELGAGDPLRSTRR